MKYISTSLLHTAWTEDERKCIDDTLLFVENYTGHNFLFDISQYLYQLLETDYIIIARQDKPESKVFMTAVLLEKGFLSSNIIAKLENSPFEGVLGNDLCYFPFGVQSIFPDDELLKQLQVESFIGIPLFDNQDNNLGVLALLHSSIIERGGFVEALLNAVLPRIEKELMPYSYSEHNLLNNTTKA